MNLPVIHGKARLSEGLRQRKSRKKNENIVLRIWVMVIEKMTIQSNHAHYVQDRWRDITVSYLKQWQFSVNRVLLIFPKKYEKKTIFYSEPDSRGDISDGSPKPNMSRWSSQPKPRQIAYSFVIPSLYS